MQKVLFILQNSNAYCVLLLVDRHVRVLMNFGITLIKHAVVVTISMKTRLDPSWCFCSFFWFFPILLACITTQFSHPPLFPVRLPNPISPTSHLPQIHSSSIFLQKKKKAVLPGILNEHGIASYNKTRHKASCQGWMRQASRRKIVPKAGQRVRDSP